MKKCYLLALSFCFIVIMGCPSHYINTDDVAIQPQQIPTVSKDKGLIFFFRDDEAVDSGKDAQGYYVMEDFKKIGASVANCSFYYETTPGHHIFWASKGNVKRYISLDVEAGKEYFVQMDTDYAMGLAQMHEAPKSIAMPAIKRSKYCPLKEPKVK